MARERTSWRQLLNEHGSGFLAWLEHERKGLTQLETIGETLSRLIQYYVSDRANDGVALWNQIPNVRAACNDQETYEAPFATEAYALVHMMERYWRTWETLEYLVSLSALPLGGRGVGLLDVGPGPGSTAYAVDDFYCALREYGQVCGVSELAGQQVRTTLCEISDAWVRFMHHFSEVGRREGPYGAELRDFRFVRLPEKRESMREDFYQSIAADGGDSSLTNGQIANMANDEVQRALRFRLCMFSNVLTTTDSVSSFQTALRDVFLELRPGSIVLVAGGVGGSYPEVYERVGALAGSCGLYELASDILGAERSGAIEDAIKRAQNSVYLHLKSLAGEGALARSRAWPDYWTPVPSTKKRTRYKIHVYRRGRWPS